MFKRKRSLRKMRTGRIADANRLFSYTVLFILLVSLLGIASYTSSYIVKLLITQVSILIPTAIYIAGCKGKRISITGVANTGFMSLAAVVMGLAILPFLSMISSISMLFVKNVTDNSAAEAAEGYPMVVMLLFVALIPAVVEELVFRGVIFGAYAGAGVIKGALFSAFLFGLMHGNLNQFAYAMVAGFLFAMTDYAGGSTVYSMIMHFTINAVSVVGLYSKRINNEFLDILFRDEAYESVSQIMSELLIPSVIGLAVAAVMYMLISRFSGCGRKTGEFFKEDNRVIFDSTLAVGVIIMVVNIIANEFI